MFLDGIFAVRTWGVLMTTVTTTSTTTVFNTATPSAMNPAATAMIKHQDPSNWPQLTPVEHIQPCTTHPHVAPHHRSLWSAIISDMYRCCPITTTISPWLPTPPCPPPPAKVTASFNANARAFKHTHMADAYAMIHRYNTSGASSLFFIFLIRIELCGCRCSW